MAYKRTGIFLDVQDAVGMKGGLYFVKCVYVLLVAMIMRVRFHS